MHVVTLPRLGQTMDQGTISSLRAEIGSDHSAGDVLYVVETEKVEVEIEAHGPGRVVRWLAEPGAELDVGDPVAVIAAAGAEPTQEEVDQVLGLTATADGGAVPAVQGGRIKAMPRARALAREHHIDLPTLAAQVGDRAIEVADVEAAIAHSPGDAADDVAGDVAGDVASEDSTGLVPLSGHRRAMARQMAASRDTIPQFDQLVEVRAERLLARRAADAATGAAPTLTAYLIEAFAAVMADEPLLRSTLVDESLRVCPTVELGVAIDTEHGLVAPVLHDLAGRSVAGIADDLTALAARARSRRLTLDDVSGATATLSNLGAAGVVQGLPVIPPSQVAMLFVGSLAQRPVVNGGVDARVGDGVLGVAPTMWVTLSCDHRVLDGATAARLIAAVKDRLEDGLDDRTGVA